MPRCLSFSMRWAVSEWICSAMARPSMRLFVPIGRGSRAGGLFKLLEGINRDHRRVGPALVEQFFPSNNDVLSKEILERHIRGRAVQIVDRFAIQVLQHE